MAVISAMKFTFVLLILSLDLCSTTIARKCPEGMFRKNRKCVQCSDCPKDQIVREICTEHKDVVCGVYTEWHQNQNVNPMPQIKVKSPAPTEVSSTSSKNNQANVIVKGDDDSQYWKILCFGLIGSLVIITIFFTLYIILLHLRFRKVQTRDKYRQPDASEMVYLQARVFSRDRLNTSDYVVNLEEQEVTSKINEKSTYRKLRDLFHPRKEREIVDQSDDVFYSESQSTALRSNRLSMIPEGGEQPKPWYRDVPPFIAPEDVTDQEDVMNICVNPYDDRATV